MILQALKGYYDRKTADSGARMAPPGFEWKEVHFIIVLKPDGTPVSIEPTHEGEGKNGVLSLSWCHRRSKEQAALQPICFGTTRSMS